MPQTKKNDPYTVVSRVRCGDAWPRKDRDAIRRAQQDYDAGTHFMFTRRAGDGHFELLTRKRKRPIARRSYFS